MGFVLLSISVEENMCINSCNELVIWCLCNLYRLTKICVLAAEMNKGSGVCVSECAQVKLQIALVMRLEPWRVWQKRKKLGGIRYHMGLSCFPLRLKLRCSLQVLQPLRPQILVIFYEHNCQKFAVRTRHGHGLGLLMAWNDMTRCQAWPGPPTTAVGHGRATVTFLRVWHGTIRDPQVLPTGTAGKASHFITNFGDIV